MLPYFITSFFLEKFVYIRHTLPADVVDCSVGRTDSRLLDRWDIVDIAFFLTLLPEDKHEFLVVENGDKGGKYF